MARQEMFVIASPLVGIVKPSKRESKSHAELVDLLPRDIRTVTRSSPVEKGTHEEFASALSHYERLAAELVEEGVDLLHTEGTPPFMILGYAEEQKLVARWEADFQTPVFTSTMCQASALRALGAKRIVDAGYDPTTGPPAENYFRDAGFEISGIEKVAIDWSEVGVASEQGCFAMLSGVIEKYPGADALCLQGSSKWRLAGIVERLEAIYGIPIVHPVAARYWELMSRLGRRGPIKNLGRLLREFPPHPDRENMRPMRRIL